VADHAHFDDATKRNKSIASAIDFVGLSHRIHRRGSDLSTAERHLAEIAKTLIGTPRLVMLDEPGAGMSGIESAHLQKVIRGIPGYCKAQVFLIDHDVELISACCTQTLVLDFGKLLALGPTLDVLKQPEVQRAYLGNADDFEKAVAS
jgi:branched-chain amino acid transport system ATP-binding protein